MQAVVDTHVQRAGLRAQDGRVPRVRLRAQPSEEPGAGQAEQDGDDAEDHRPLACAQRVVDHPDVAELEAVLDPAF